MPEPTILDLKRDRYVGRYMEPIKLARGGEAANIVREAMHRALFANWLERNYEV